MAAVQVAGVSYRYGRRVEALSDVSLTVPSGAVYALLGPNGAGKTTLLQILAGLRRPTAGWARVLGKDVTTLGVQDWQVIGYVAEGLRLPGWMTLRQLEAYLAPLYPEWDRSLADELRRRFRLDPDRRIRTFSRGEHMKAALLCALAPRPRLLLMDEPFTGMDVAVKDELVHGLLESAGTEGWTVVVASHDLAELEPLADWVGFLDDGRLLLSESMETLRARFRRVEVVGAGEATSLPSTTPEGWLSVRRAGPRVSLIVADGDAVEGDAYRRWFPDAMRIEVREATLREVFVALVRREQGSRRAEEVAA